MSLISPCTMQALKEHWNVHPNHFHVDLFNPDYEKYPHLEELRVLETPVETGDVVFIPEGQKQLESDDNSALPCCGRLGISNIPQ